jgi:HEAT repeat protein
LIIIPAVIVAICIGLSVMFGLLAGGQADIDAYLAKLRQSGGAGRMAFDIQDPRYKDRSLAAYNVATMIPTIDDPAERQRISDELVSICRSHVGHDEHLLQSYLLLAIGQLGGNGGMDAILEQLDASHPTVRAAAVQALLAWPKPDEAHRTIEPLIGVLDDTDAMVVAMAAAALGALAPEADRDQVVPALHTVLARTGADMRDAVWNAAVALARQGDPKGASIVANVLFDREALSKLRVAANTGADPQRGINAAEQDRVILSTLLATGEMTDERVWDKISQLAEHDPNPRVRTEAQSALDRRSADQ